MDPVDFMSSGGDPGYFNRYAYTFNDPVNFTDPTGMCASENGELTWPEGVTYNPSENTSPELVSAVTDSVNAVANGIASASADNPLTSQFQDGLENATSVTVNFVDGESSFVNADDAITLNISNDSQAGGTDRQATLERDQIKHVTGTEFNHSSSVDRARMSSAISQNGGTYSTSRGTSTGSVERINDSETHSFMKSERIYEKHVPRGAVGYR